MLGTSRRASANLVDVQDMAGHHDPRTTRRYDRARGRLDRDPSYALAGLLDISRGDSAAAPVQHPP